ncbi:flagella protein [Halobacteria archaeon AArc-dxtr1]|nr:flagella protein [Halobacteria archaeon AArc-dxtr1]
MVDLPNVFGKREEQADKHDDGEEEGDLFGDSGSDTDVFGDLGTDSRDEGVGESDTSGPLLSDGGSDDDLLGGGDDDLLGEDEMLTGGGNTGATELSYRLDDVEEEVDTLQNRVEIFRGENEQISNRVETVDKNVEKLVDLYEIVTRGINPFVGDQELGNAFDTGEGAFGAQQGPDVDDELAAADADEFLDDEFEDEEDDDDEFGDALAEDAENDEFEADEALSEEFEADLGDGSADADDEHDGSAGTDDKDDDHDDSAGTDDGFELAFDESAASEDDEPEHDPGVDSHERPSESDGPLNGEFGEPPYLVTHRARDDVELVTLEWLQFLVEKSGVQGAARTIAYYESVGWISEEASEYLHSMLDGFGTAQQRVGKVSGDGRSPLTVAEHKQSLQYIAWIATPDQAPDLGAEMEEVAGEMASDTGVQ